MSRDIPPEHREHLHVAGGDGVVIDRSGHRHRVQVELLDRPPGGAWKGHLVIPVRMGVAVKALDVPFRLEVAGRTFATVHATRITSLSGKCRVQVAASGGDGRAT